MAEWSIAAVLKTVEGHTSGGSNPSLSANNKDKTAVSQRLAAVFDFIYIQKYIQIAGQSQSHTDVSVSWKIKRREENIVSYQRLS